MNEMSDMLAPEDQPAKTRAPEGMAGLAKGLAIVEMFGQTRSAVTVSAAADVTGISRASARRCLITLTELGYLAKIGTHFLPTPRMLRLGQSYTATVPLPQLAQPHLDAAREELGESVSLSTLEAGYSVFVARAEVDRLVSTVVRLGTRLPAYASATGRILLSGLDDDEIESYFATVDVQPLTAKTVVGTARLREIIHLAREEKVAFTDEELALGMISMAVPVTDSHDRIVAAMSVSGASVRVSIAMMQAEMLPALRRYADALSRSL